MSHRHTVDEGTGLLPGVLASAPRVGGRLRVEVPARGICETLLRDLLGVTSAEINGFLGDELGAPRDYTFPPGGRGYAFTLAGVRRLVGLLGLDAEVIAEGADRAEPVMMVRRARGPWWLADQSED